MSWSRADYARDADEVEREAREMFADQVRFDRDTDAAAYSDGNWQRIDERENAIADARQDAEDERNRARRAEQRRERRDYRRGRA